MADFEFGLEKRLSRLTLGRAEVLNARFLEVANASATKLDKTGGTMTGGLSIIGNFSTSGTFAATGNATLGGTLAVTGAVTLASTLTLSGNPSSNLHAAPKQYVDAGDAAKLNLSGGTMSGDIAMGANAITGVKDPVNGQDATNKAWVLAQITSILDGAPGALDTLNELAAAMGDDPNFAATMTTALAGKLSLSGGSMTGSLDFNNQFGVNVPTPTQSHHIAPKSYVDAVVGSIAGAEAAALSAAGSATAAAAAAASINPADFVPSTRTITAGTGLTGGGDLSANRTFAVDVGTTANKIVQLDSSGRLPAVSGALLTDLPAPSVLKATRLEATQGTDDTKFLTSLVVASAADFTFSGVGSGDYFWTPRAALASEGGANHRVAASGARTIRNPTNAPYRGQTGIFAIFSTTSTAHTISWDTQFVFPGSLPVLPSTANRAIVVRWTNLGMFSTPRLLCEVLHTNFDVSS